MLDISTLPLKVNPALLLKLTLMRFYVRCNVLRDLVLFVQLKKREKNTHGGVLLLVTLLATACNFTKCNSPPGCFTFLNCSYGNKSRKASPMIM